MGADFSTRFFAARGPDLQPSALFLDARDELISLYRVLLRRQEFRRFLACGLAEFRETSGVGLPLPGFAVGIFALVLGAHDARGFQFGQQLFVNVVVALAERCGIFVMCPETGEASRADFFGHFGGFWELVCVDDLRREGEFARLGFCGRFVREVGVRIVAVGVELKKEREASAVKRVLRPLEREVRALPVGVFDDGGFGRLIAKRGSQIVRRGFEIGCRTFDAFGARGIRLVRIDEDVTGAEDAVAIVDVIVSGEAVTFGMACNSLNGLGTDRDGHVVSRLLGPTSLVSA